MIILKRLASSVIILRISIINHNLKLVINTKKDFYLIQCTFQVITKYQRDLNDLTY